MVQAAAVARQQRGWTPSPFFCCPVASRARAQVLRSLSSPFICLLFCSNPLAFTAGGPAEWTELDGRSLALAHLTVMRIFFRTGSLLPLPEEQALHQIAVLPRCARPEDPHLRSRKQEGLGR